MLFTAAEIAKEMNKEKMSCVTKSYTTREVAKAINDLILVPSKLSRYYQGKGKMPPVCCFAVNQVVRIKKRVKTIRIHQNNYRINFTKKYLLKEKGVKNDNE